MQVRTLRRVHAPRRDDIRELVTRRPDHPLERIEPFLFINHHGPQTYPPGNDGLPFGPHPHRGFETVTFIVEGELLHRDSGGHESSIEAGGVQWMTAGRGVEHSETSPPRFLREGGKLEILQLWLNLPAELKMTAPRYIGLQREQIPSIEIGEGKGAVHLIAGAFGAHRGPIESLTGVSLLTLSLEPGGRVMLPAPQGRTVLLYIVRGAIDLAGQEVRAFHLAELKDDGPAVELAATASSFVIFGHADPIREPIVAHGPFVMNTREEIVQAVRDYQAGRFGAVDPSAL